MCKSLNKTPIYKLINFILLNPVKSLLKNRSYIVFSFKKREYYSERKYLKRKTHFSKIHINFFPLGNKPLLNGVRPSPTGLKCNSCEYVTM